MATEPLNKRGPQTAIGDTVLELGVVFVMRVPYDMLEQESTDTGGSPPPHPCVLITRSRLGSTVELEFFVLRSFGGRAPREATERSLTANEFLPLPYPSDYNPGRFWRTSLCIGLENAVSNVVAYTSGCHSYSIPH